MCTLFVIVSNTMPPRTVQLLPELACDDLLRGGCGVCTPVPGSAAAAVVRPPVAGLGAVGVVVVVVACGQSRDKRVFSAWAIADAFV